ncbi:MAG: GTPase Era [Actinomycetota bacterium]
MGDLLRSGVVVLVGRPNVGKSSLVNRLVGRKVSITSRQAQTTRSIIKGVANAADGSWQLVLVDTPGLHKPRVELGRRLNRMVHGSLADADVICLLIDATQPVGSGDQLVASRVTQAGARVVVAVTKSDLVGPDRLLPQLEAAASWDFESYVPVSSLTGEGIPALIGELVSRIPEGPAYFPPGLDTDQPEEAVVAEIIREKFLSRLRDELPHSLHVRLTSMEDDEGLVRIGADVLVERDSQKGIVIGKGGELLGSAGTEARHELEALLATRIHLQLRVRVDPDWQRRSPSLDRLGFGDSHHRFPS